jgi:hypothetical protein
MEISSEVEGTMASGILRLIEYNCMDREGECSLYHKTIKKQFIKKIFKMQNMTYGAKFSKLNSMLDLTHSRPQTQF